MHQNTLLLILHLLTLCSFLPSACSEPAVGEGGADDGVVLPALGGPDERRQVPSFREGPAQELLRHRHVHGSPASTAVFRLQVRTNNTNNKNNTTANNGSPFPDCRYGEEDGPEVGI